jgi:molybdate transport system substrate-binding protein
MKGQSMKNRHTRIPETILHLLLIGLLCLVVVIGCSKKETEDKPRELVILCGSSFPKPTEQLYSEFTAQTGIKTVITIAGSEDFLPLVKTGQKGDILVTHDPFLDYVADANALADYVHVGFVAPVLAVQKGNPKGLTSIQDLTLPGLKVALTDPKYSTCGEMVFALLDKKGIKEAVMKNVENRLTKGHSNLGNFLKTQAVDVVIMWNGVAHTFRDSVEVVRTPYEYDEEIRVHIIGLSYSKEPESLKQFIEFARTRGPEIFAEYGYVK